MQFVYVMCRNDAEMLVDYGFTILKEDARNKLWVLTMSNPICNELDTNFALEKSGIQYVLSNILTF